MAKSATKLQNVSVLVARNRLGAILERAKKNDERFVVSKKGEATAVILGYEDFLRSVLGLKEPAVLRIIRERARRSGAAQINHKTIDSEIRKAREEKRTKRAS
jgi:prevent-host-death family protein